MHITIAHANIYLYLLHFYAENEIEIPLKNVKPLCTCLWLNFTIEDTPVWRTTKGRKTHDTHPTLLLRTPLSYACRHLLSCKRLHFLTRDSWLSCMDPLRLQGKIYFFSIISDKGLTRSSSSVRHFLNHRFDTLQAVMGSRPTYTTILCSY